MPLPKPNLDDKTFDQLVNEAKKLIPRYAPEWTDHNLSDPGITFIDLFAWLTEIELYRINLVTEEHRLKYLDLLGFKPKPSLSAKVDLTFNSNEKKSLEKGTVVSTEIAGRNIHFELLDKITIVPLTLGRILVDGFTEGVIDRTNTNEQGDLFFAPFSEKAQEGCTLYLGFECDSKPDALSFMCYRYEKDLIRPGKHGDEEDYKFDNARLKWEISVSSDGTKWENVTPTDGTEDFKKSGRIIFEELEGWTASSTIPVWEGDIPYFWIRCTVEESNYEYPPRIDNIKINTVSASHGLTIRNYNETWLSNGLPNQIFELKNTPILDRTLKLSVNDNKWEEVDDFAGSGPED